MAQIRFRIDTVQTAGADQPVQQFHAFAAVIAAKEHKVFLSETDCTKRSFRSIIIRLRQTVITEGNRGHPTDSVQLNALAQSGFFDSVPFFSTIHSCSDVSNYFFCCLDGKTL